MAVSGIGGPKALLFRQVSNPIGQLRWSGHVTPCILLIGRSFIQLRAVIFSNAPPGALEGGPWRGAPLSSLLDPTALWSWLWIYRLGAETLDNLLVPLVLTL